MCGEVLNGTFIVAQPVAPSIEALAHHTFAFWIVDADGDGLAAAPGVGEPESVFVGSVPKLFQHQADLEGVDLAAFLRRKLRCSHGLEQGYGSRIRHQSRRSGLDGSGGLQEREDERNHALRVGYP